MFSAPEYPSAGAEVANLGGGGESVQRVGLPSPGV